MAAFNISGVQDWGSQRWRRREHNPHTSIASRREIRFFSTTSVRINYGGMTRVGLLRDISRTGLFLYSDFTPEAGDELELSFKLPTDGRLPLGVVCRGCVVRVEDKRTGAAVGIGIKLLECRLQKPEPKATRFP